MFSVRRILHPWGGAQLEYHLLSLPTIQCLLGHLLDRCSWVNLLCFPSNLLLLSKFNASTVVWHGRLRHTYIRVQSIPQLLQFFIRLTPKVPGKAEDDSSRNGSPDPVSETWNGSWLRHRPALAIMATCPLESKQADTKISLLLSVSVYMCVCVSISLCISMSLYH